MFFLRIAATLMVLLPLVTAQKAIVLLRSKNYEDYTWGVRDNGDAYIKQGYGGDAFRILPGLSGKKNGKKTVSFMSLEHPCSYLRHYNFFLHLESSKNPRNASTFDENASFIPRPNLFFRGYTAYESVNYPNHFIRHGDFRLQIRPYDRHPLFKTDASFKPEKIVLQKRCSN
ncbi:uncharacterized protein LOC106180469 [Lingula anatina]|uniref:Uncharacterized protein LOC106180469 n=1 Tax=Lingula anatina TaxID=7574 RepID=A0A1S3KBA0_LINAN|nr:uncharacterized protein LOC106180469 [Lingula anatina]|eukprot:XP_013419910.1 uncharacterized protein LOC106180469 [Lingula anatina]